MHTNRGGDERTPIFLRICPCENAPEAVSVAGVGFGFQQLWGSRICVAQLACKTKGYGENRLLPSR